MLDDAEPNDDVAELLTASKGLIKLMMSAKSQVKINCGHHFRGPTLAHAR
ncbi:hypothetical protein [Plantactinospora soyae]|uniref:Uncharacterized protein n=1 Tax=Plantactinospora soyae TaxID=1544732 RepID=A0A927QY88_9ACTN|nr:hypothetical protein [Plantactinospora soyae]MBE1486283.1 hypothetical protein [Plantactinospora soyae]